MKIHKVPKGINVPPPFAWGLTGNQFIVLTSFLMMLGLLSLTFKGVWILWGWLINGALLGFAYLLCRLSNILRRGAIKHYLIYFFHNGKVPKRYSGRGISGKV